MIAVGRVIFASLFLLSAGCSRRDLRAVIQDASGHPLPDAIFYAEAYDSSGGAFDFAFAKSGSNGEVPRTGSGPLTIAWKPGAKLAMAAFAAGKKPIAIYDELGRVQANGVTIRLENLPASGMRWDARIAKLSFPFQDEPALRKRAASPDCAPLRKAFLDAYGLLGGVGLPAELAKLRSLEQLDRGETQ